MASEKYKRQWRNLLLNKGYQLRFTLVMVGLSTALMVGLGIWVMRVADETTEVSQASVMGTPCPPIPELAAAEPASPPPSQVPMTPASPPAPEGSAAGAEAGKAEPTDTEDADRSQRKIVVSLDPMELPKSPKASALPADYAVMVVKHWTCRLKIDAAKESLEHGRDRILWVMILTGLLLVLGLAVYGIKMTHKVAGPLFKVSLYLKKMRNGRFDKVYNLRKGDQLLDFYEHFRHAHAGVVKMQQADIERVQAVIAAAESAGAGDEPAVRELRDLLARKEKSIE
jgi:ABC-type multidrug transport system fused ATPase/permease subunit